MASFEENPRSTWLSRLEDFRKLEERYPGQLYLIQSQGSYAYFTAAKVRDQIRYDFSGENTEWVR